MSGGRSSVCALSEGRRALHLLILIDDLQTDGAGRDAAAFEEIRFPPLSQQTYRGRPGVSEGLWMFTAPACN